MIVTSFTQKLVLLVIGLAAGSSIVVPAGYASFHPVTSSEIQDGTIQSVDIEDGEIKAADIGTGQVKAAEIAPDSVGASELQGVTKLVFTTCTVDYANTMQGNFASDDCVVPGLVLNDKIMATQKTIDSHMSFEGAFAGLDVSDNVVIRIYAKNTGDEAHNAGPMEYAVIVYR